MNLKDKLRLAASPEHDKAYKRMEETYARSHDMLASLRDHKARIDRRLLMNHLAELAETGPEEYREIFHDAADAIHQLSDLLHFEAKKSDGFVSTHAKAQREVLEMKGRVGGLEEYIERLREEHGEAHELLDSELKNKLAERLKEKRADRIKRAAEKAREAVLARGPKDK